MEIRTLTSDILAVHRFTFIEGKFLKTFYIQIFRINIKYRITTTNIEVFDNKLSLELLNKQYALFCTVLFNKTPLHRKSESNATVISLKYSSNYICITSYFGTHIIYNSPGTI